MGGSSKSGGGAGGGMNDYFGDIAGVICSGPIDRLCAILVDGKKVWPDTGSGLDRAGQPNPVQLTITGYGAAWLYWGTTTQTLDASGEFNLAANGHPPYRRQAVLSLQKFLFGREKISAPSVECIVRRTPLQTIITGTAALLDVDGQANPLAVLAELLTDPVFGLGLPTIDIDATSWQATADALLARSSQTYISPVFDRPASARSLVDDLRGYFDGWFRADTAAKIVAGRFLHGEAAPTFDSTNTLTADDLLDEPAINSDGWSKTINELAVKFQDAENAFKDSAFTINSGYNRQITGEPRQSNFERPFITRRAQIAALASEFLKLSAEPGFTATLVVRAPKGVAYPTGTILKFTHDLLGVDLICRVTERTEAAPPSERVTLRIEAERGITATPLPVVAGVSIITNGNGVERLPRYYFAMPPANLFGESYLFVPLVARRVAATLGFNLFYRSDDASQLQELGTQGTFAVRGTLTQAYAASIGAPDDNSETLRIAIDADTTTGDLERVTNALTEDEVQDDTLLLWIIRADNPNTVEILSVRALRLISGQWYAKVRRARGGTVAASFAAADECWLIRYEDLITYRHSRLPALAAAGATVKLRLQAIGFGGTEAALDNAELCPDLLWKLRPGTPPDVTSFTVEGSRFSWSAVADKSVVGYRLRYQPGTRQEWSDAAELHTGIITTNPFEPTIIPKGSTTFLLKAVDVTGAESVNPAVIVANLGDPIVANVVETFDRRAAIWPGTRSGFSIDGSNNLAANSITTMWAADDTAPMWAGDGAAAMWPALTYAAATYIDSVTITQALAGSTMTLTATVAGDPWKIEYRENSPALMWAVDANAAMWTDDAAAFWDVPDWQAWPGQVTVPGNTIYDFRFSTGEAQTQGTVSAFAVVVDAPDITESINNAVLVSGGTRLTLTQTYRVIKNISLTIQQDGNGAASVQIIDKLKTGPLIQAKNSAGAGVAALIDARIQGY
jgi:hypothetical protein